MEHQDWQCCIAFDESCFYWSKTKKLSGCRTVNHPWRGEGSDSPEKYNGHNHMESSRVSFCRRTSKRKKNTFTATHYIEHILESMPALCPKSGPPHLIIHADNARSHTAWRPSKFCDSNYLRIAPHPPYSPDLTPLDGHLSEYLKLRLKGSSYLLEEELLLGIHIIGRRSEGSFWKTCSGTGWIYWFGSPHTKVMTVVKVNPRWFIFVKSCLGTEMPHAGGTPDKRSKSSLGNRQSRPGSDGRWIKCHSFPNLVLQDVRAFPMSRLSFVKRKKSQSPRLSKTFYFVNLRCTQQSIQESV
jgi:hypothetical protein